MSIWDLGIQSFSKKETSHPTNESDTTLFFIGDKSSGKSTIISKFLDKNDTVKPTVALDYSFGRQIKGHNTLKFVAHIWELGGGTWLQKLIDVAITPDNLKTLTIVVVVDLSEPNSIFSTIEILLNVATARIKCILEKLNDDGSTQSFLEEKMMNRIEKSNDKEIQKPFLIPLVIIGGKFDKFEKFDLKRRTVVCKTLRFLNHYYGGSLMFFSSNQEPLISKLRILLRHCAFESSTNKTMETSPKNAIYIPVGTDAFEDIGAPEFSDGSLKQLSNEKLVQYWKRAYSSFFSPKDSVQTEITNPGKNKQFAEPLVDEAKLQKDEELEKYRKLSDRKMRDLRQQAINDGIIVI